MKRIATISAVLALLAIPSSALAQSSSTCQAYSNQTCSVSAISQGQGPTGSTLPVSSTTTSTTSAGSLPFTGLDLGLLVIGGASLLGAGVFARRLSRRLN